MLTERTWNISVTSLTTALDNSAWVTQEAVPSVNRRHTVR